METLHVGDVEFEVVQKNIKNIYLRVYPPDGRVRLSAPRRMGAEEIRVFAISRIPWIQRQRERLARQGHANPLCFEEGEFHPVWGVGCVLRVVERAAAPRVFADDGALVLQVRPGATVEKKQAVLDRWYGEEVRRVAEGMVAEWAPRMGVEVTKLSARRMKTRWGSCSTRTGHVRLSTGLARRRPELLEYVVIHELAHLIEASHGPRFYRLMDRFLPGWQTLRAELNGR